MRSKQRNPIVAWQKTLKVIVKCAAALYVGGIKRLSEPHHFNSGSSCSGACFWCQINLAFVENMTGFYQKHALLRRNLCYWCSTVICQIMLCRKSCSQANMVHIVSLNTILKTELEWSHAVGKFFEYFNKSKTFLCHNFGNLSGGHCPYPGYAAGFSKWSQKNSILLTQKTLE